MAQHAWKCAGQLAARLMDVGETQAAGAHLDEHLVCPGIGHGKIPDLPSCVRAKSHDGFHVAAFLVIPEFIVAGGARLSA
jgi:hypothetical protein